jgi:hypothetical protein
MALERIASEAYGRRLAGRCVEQSNARVLGRVSDRDRGASRPPDEDRAFDTGRVDDPSMSSTAACTE